MWIVCVCLLTIASITVAMDADCEKPPIWDYNSSMGCCKHSVITYTDDAMNDCKMYNTSSIPNNKDLILMNVCQIQCYLNKSGLMNTDGSIRQKKLVKFLQENLKNDEVKTLVGRATSKCLSEGILTSNATTSSRVQKTKTKGNETHEANCQPYYTSLIDCIQGEFFMNCPEEIRNQSKKCAATRLFVRYCGIGKLREMFTHPHASDKDSDEDSSPEYEDSDEDSSAEHEDSDEDSSPENYDSDEDSSAEHGDSVEDSSQGYETSDSDQSKSGSESSQTCKGDSEDYSDSEYESENESEYDDESESSESESMELKTASAARQKKLLSFLRGNLQSNEVKTLLGKITSKCSSIGQRMKRKKNLEAKCQSYYASLIDCIQGEIFMNCPETLGKPLEKCAAIRLFVRYCDKARLREMFGHPDSGDEDSSLEYEDSDSESESESEYESEYESESSETCKCGSKDNSDSEYESESESEYISESESSENESTELAAAVRQKKLLKFLRDNLQSNEVKTLLGKITSKCSSKGEHKRRNKNFDANCQPYYASLIDCIQEEIFINCPERLSSPSEKCAATRLFQKYCGMTRFRKMLGHSDAGDEDSSSEYEDSDSDQSESDSSETCKSDSEDYSDSEYESENESDYDYDSDSKSS